MQSANAVLRNVLDWKLDLVLITENERVMIHDLYVWSHSGPVELVLLHQREPLY